eukprot:Sspe_Gene.43106::Locus_20965_Transcript_2_2_Confidence_0.500_Length_915::g.43106::m.43106
MTTPPANNNAQYGDPRLAPTRFEYQLVERSRIPPAFHNISDIYAFVHADKKKRKGGQVDGCNFIVTRRFCFLTSRKAKLLRVLRHTDIEQIIIKEQPAGLKVALVPYSSCQEPCMVMVLHGRDSIEALRTANYFRSRELPDVPPVVRFVTKNMRDYIRPSAYNKPDKYRSPEWIASWRTRPPPTRTPPLAPAGSPVRSPASPLSAPSGSPPPGPSPNQSPVKPPVSHPTAPGSSPMASSPSAAFADKGQGALVEAPPPHNPKSTSAVPPPHQ